jgi:hypothetical protein
MNDRKLWTLLTPKPRRTINLSISVDLFKALAYYYLGSTSMYFVLMVPTNLGLEDTYTLPIAQWLYSSSTWMAPMVVLLLWLLVCVLVGVGVLYILKGIIYLITDNRHHI